jgi:hypothetical protein
VCAEIPDIDAWHDLWSRLCHQGTVYPASYAALPLLLDAATTSPASGRADALILMAAIITADDLHGVERPTSETIDRIAHAATQLADTCLHAMAGDAVSFLYLLEAAAAFDGDLIWGRNLQYLSDGAYEGQCPICSQALHFAIGERYGFFVSAEEWTKPPEAGVAIHPADPAHLSGRGAWLHDRAIRNGQAVVAMWITYLFGTTACPAATTRLMCRRPSRSTDLRVEYKVRDWKEAIGNGVRVVFRFPTTFFPG